MVMFRRGDIFDNPVTGERATILLGTRETRGDRLVVELELRGTGFGSPLHMHPSIHERWKVLSGRVGMIIKDSISIAEAGNVIGLAQDGKTDAMGMPHLLQLASIASEFGDVIRFLSPPRLVQSLLFPV